MNRSPSYIQLPNISEWRTCVGRGLDYAMDKASGCAGLCFGLSGFTEVENHTGVPRCFHSHLGAGTSWCFCAAEPELVADFFLASRRCIFPAGWGYQGTAQPCCSRGYYPAWQTSAVVKGCLVNCAVFCCLSLGFVLSRYCKTGGTPEQCSPLLSCLSVQSEAFLSLVSTQNDPFQLL